MKKIFMCTAVMATICLLLGGCGNNDINHKGDDSIPSAAAIIEKDVMEISIQIKSENNDSTKSYSDHDKISEICDYIRLLTWNDLTNENPDEESGAEYVVTYTNEDGTTKAYYFKENQYFKTDSFDWKIISNLEEFKDIVED